MTHGCSLLALALALLVPMGLTDDANPLYRDLLDPGLTLGQTTVRLPEPTLPDGKDAEAGLTAIRNLTGDPRSAREFLRDSVSAPFLLKSRDVPTPDAIVRVVDLWFVVHARLEDIDLDRMARQADRHIVEAGNMRFESQYLSDQDLQEAKVPRIEAAPGRTEWFTHLSGRLLDRIAVEATDHVIATRTPESLVIAARTDLRFDPRGRFPNRWTSLTRKGSQEVAGPVQPYAGSASYLKITAIPGEPGALFVEAHFAYVEPLGWFQGNPILRSKSSLIAQDQIRRLRRDLQKQQGKP